MRILLGLLLLTSPACSRPAKDTPMNTPIDLSALPEAWRGPVEAPITARVKWLAKTPIRVARVRPVTIDGATLPHFVVIEYTVGDAPAPNRYETVIAGGEEITARGPAAATKALRAAGFPATPIASPNLLVALLNHFELFGERPVWDAFERGPRVDATATWADPRTLQIDYPRQPAGAGGDAAPETVRLVVNFGAQAEIAMTEAVRPSGGDFGPPRPITPAAASR